MKDRPKSAGQLYSGGQNRSPFSLQIGVYELGEDGFEAWVKEAGKTWTKTFTDIGSKDIKITRVETTKSYEGFQAVEMEIKWEWTDGSTILTNINHYILKGDKVISLSSTLIGDIFQARDMFDEIDLNPEIEEDKTNLNLDIEAGKADLKEDEEEEEDEEDEEEK